MFLRQFALLRGYPLFQGFHLSDGLSVFPARFFLLSYGALVFLRQFALLRGYIFLRRVAGLYGFSVPFERPHYLFLRINYNAIHVFERRLRPADGFEIVFILA